MKMQPKSNGRYSRDHQENPTQEESLHCGPGLPHVQSVIIRRHTICRCRIREGYAEGHHDLTKFIEVVHDAGKAKMTRRLDSRGRGTGSDGKSDGQRRS